MFVSPSMGEVGGLSLAARFPYIYELFFLDKYLVRGFVGLDKTMLSGFCMTYFLFYLSFLVSSFFVVFVPHNPSQLDSFSIIYSLGKNEL
jgi:hypothetical protein